MPFVPTPVTPVEDVSPRARDLVRTLEGSMEEYRQRNPGLTEQEVRQALMLLGRHHGAGGRASLAVALGVGVAVLGVVFFMFVRSGPAAGTDDPVQWIAIMIGAVAAMLGLFAAARRRGG